MSELEIMGRLAADAKHITAGLKINEKNNALLKIADLIVERTDYIIEENKKDISDIIIFSDGFENSFISYNDMIENIDKTILAYKKSVFSRYILEKNYEKYLKNLSENNSLDDISIIFVNIF